MNFAKSLIASLFASVLLVTVLHFLPDSLAFLSHPGIVVEVMLTGFLLLLVFSGDHYPQLPIGIDTVINVLFYLAPIFLLLRGLKRLRHSG